MNECLRSHYYDEDEMHEECGVFGIYDFDGNDVANTIYYGLFALQHRGQESCGIAVSDTAGPKGKVSSLKGMGLVNEVYTPDSLSKLKGNIGVGHVRYSTAGASTIENAQPLVLNYVKGTLGLAHNGNLVNAPELRRELELTGAIFQTTIDSEVIAYHIARERVKCGSVEEAVTRALKKVRGSYSLVIMSPRKLIGARDPFGFRPLCIGSMTAFITYTMLIIMSFLMLSMMSVMLPRASVAADRIQEIIDTDVTVQDAAGAKKLEAPRGVVKYDNVAFAYPGADENVLENISFEAKPGQTTAIIGSTGCGKSTLVQLLPRFYDVTEGSITIDGQDIRDLTMESVRQNIGFVPQKGILFSGTIASNIRFGAPDASDEDVKLAAEIAQASDFIEEKEHGYDSAVAQGGGNVSGGQKQRLAIARAIARKPKILIFDDSFSALDFKTDVAVRKALGEHVNDSTVFIVAQRVSTILSADQILVLDEGTIVGKGTHKELMQTCEEYRQIAESQLSPSEIAASLGTDSERQV